MTERMVLVPAPTTLAVTVAVNTPPAVPEPVHDR